MATEHTVTATLKVTVRSLTAGAATPSIQTVLDAWQRYTGGEILMGRELAEGQDLDAFVSIEIVNLTPSEQE